jgi:transcription antitermination protein NusB
VGRRTKARECAFQMLYQWGATQATMAQVEEDYWRLRSTTDETRARAERLARGTAALAPEIDDAIRAAATNWRFERIAAVDRTILRLGAYELMREDETPAAVVIDEAVELAKRFGEAESHSFVNGVLDAIRRKVRAGAPTPAPSRGAGGE